MRSNESTKENEEGQDQEDQEDREEDEGGDGDEEEKEEERVIENEQLTLHFNAAVTLHCSSYTCLQMLPFIALITRYYSSNTLLHKKKSQSLRTLAQQ